MTAASWALQHLAAFIAGGSIGFVLACVVGSSRT